MTDPAVSPIDALPCPFCGGAPLSRAFGQTWYIECSQCGGTTTGVDSIDLALATWARRATGGWQPIATAPRDETPIIAGFDCASVWIVHKAWWRDGAALQAIGLDFTEADTGWWSYTTGSVTQEQLDGYRTPTHWLPMPDLPK